MAPLLTQYPYLRDLEWHVPMSQGLDRGGSFSQMAQEPVSDDKYLCELVREIGKYQKKVTSTMKLIPKPAREDPPKIPPVQLMELLFTYLLEVPLERKTVTIKMALRYTQVTAHHSSILIDMIQNWLGSSGDEAPRLNDRNLQCLRRLKEGLVTFNVSLEKVLLYYTFMQTIDRPKIDEIRRAITLVKDVLRVMKREQIEKIFAPKTSELQTYHPFDPQEHRFGITQDDILCSILGLSGAMTKQLRCISEEERDHRTDEYLVLEVLDHVYRTKAETMEDTSTESRFLSSVFNRATAQIFRDLLEDNPMRKQQSELYWAKRLMENKFEYDILLNDDIGPLDPDSEFIDVKITCRDTDDSEVPKTVQVPTSYARKSEDVDAFILKVSADKNDVFFHGTDAESGKSIIENGIMLESGNRHQDFSDGYGFYVTENGRTAFDWARHGNFAPSGAVVAFKVPTNTLEGFKKLDLTQDDLDTWKNIINYNRCGENRKRFNIPAELKKTLGKADFVVGPKCIPEKADWPQKDLVPQSDTQVCIRTDRMAAAMRDVKNISVCFFDKKVLVSSQSG